MDKIYDIDNFIDNNYLINNKLSSNIFIYLKRVLQNYDNEKFIYNYFNIINNYNRINIYTHDNKVSNSYIDYEILKNGNKISKRFIIDYILFNYQIIKFIDLFTYNNNDNYINKFITYIKSILLYEEDKNNFIKYLL